jgi:antitoxin component of MazEF toxin-antitoxin module
MGREAHCTAHHDGVASVGKLLLETDALLFRGDFRLKIPLKQVGSAAARNGELHITWPAGTARFELGNAAERWAESIRQPKSLLDKLGVKPDHSVSVIRVTDGDFLTDLSARAADVTVGMAGKTCDIVFFQTDDPKELKALAALARLIRPAGAIWVITPKKRPEIADTVVMQAGKAAGLVDVKVARVSETHTALKFVIPRQNR